MLHVIDHAANGRRWTPTTPMSHLVLRLYIRRANDSRAKIHNIRGDRIDRLPEQIHR